MPLLQIKTVNMLKALSMALELAVDGVNCHQMRTALICRAIGEEMGLTPKGQERLLSAALLHDIGAAPGATERAVLLDPLMEEALGDGIFEHARAGHELLCRSDFFRPVAKIILHHHDRWEGGNSSGLQGQDIPLESRIIHVADRIEVLLGDSPALDRADAVRDKILDMSGARFDPDVVAAFVSRAKHAGFWRNVSRKTPIATGNEHWGFGQDQFASPVEIMNIAELYATLIDRVSLFTAAHSRSVGAVAALLAGHCGFSEEKIIKIRIAGLLHDIGKTCVSNSILEKPGLLSEIEKDAVKKHAYHSFRILEQVEEAGVVAKWAAFHHETLDGTGYPFKLPDPALPLGSKVVAVADIFVALTENRPHRPPMGREGILATMDQMRRERKIDALVTQALFDVCSEAEAAVRRQCEAGLCLTGPAPLRQDAESGPVCNRAVSTP